MIPPEFDILIRNLRDAIAREKSRGRFSLVTALRNQLCGLYAKRECEKRRCQKN